MIAEGPEALTATDAALRGLALQAEIVAFDFLTVITCGGSLFIGTTACEAIERDRRRSGRRNVAACLE
ncbi:hypothetical protein KTR66_04780 [Roseococcus sp. SDR]|uniref:hypothetical protein n=1 Tax=Roseococcus sp. SDR TaxID=2835532 RepID=UPI001BCD5E93|nr:hypothetical protein [Roseococcus sp. SDR]MBS7789295.1 hypothetical protein [Roseococcus sp. SDR]MBV1844609.1 hypothetical protein [Roseococcus sp. SDR]